MQDDEFWLDRFEEHRPRLRAVAYRMLGSQAEADDALQETWLRISRASGRDVENVGGWLTTVVSRQCLNAARAAHPARGTARGARARSRRPRRARGDPAEQSPLADTVGIALLVVLDSLEPAERRRSCCTTCSGCRSTTSRRSWSARRPLRASWPAGLGGGCRAGRSTAAGSRPAARRGGRMGRRVALGRLRGPAHPAAPGRGAARRRRSRVVAHEDRPRSRGDRRLGDRVRHATAVEARIAQVNGLAGIVASVRGQAVSVLAFTVVDGLVTEVDILSDRKRLRLSGSAEDARRGPGQRRPISPITGGPSTRRR